MPLSKYTNLKLPSWTNKTFLITYGSGQSRQQQGDVHVRVWGEGGSRSDILTKPHQKLNNGGVLISVSLAKLEWALLHIIIISTVF